MARRVRRWRRCIATVMFVGCASSGSTETVEAPTSPLPTAGLAGNPVTVYPLTMLVSEPELGWDDRFADRRASLDRADSLIAAYLTERSPEVTWVLPEVLRRAAHRAPGLLPDPDQMGTSFLRHGTAKVPDPLRSQLRMLTGTAGDRFALVPASLWFFADETGVGRAELMLVLADVRLGTVGWMTVAKGTGDGPWEALRVALGKLTPGLP